MAPLFAHLARDPYPCALMKSRAPNVFRWTERMNLPGLFDGEFPDIEPDYPRDDAIPDTVQPLVAYIFRTWGPELLANAERYNAWVAENPTLKSGDLVSVPPERQLHPSVGEVSYTLRGRTIRCNSTPQSLWHFDKALQRVRALRGVARERFEALVKRTGGKQVMAISLARPLRREDYVLVVG
jgi:hypothetical protein